MTLFPRTEHQYIVRQHCERWRLRGLSPLGVCRCEEASICFDHMAYIDELRTEARSLPFDEARVVFNEASTFYLRLVGPLMPPQTAPLATHCRHCSARLSDREISAEVCTFCQHNEPFDCAECGKSTRPANGHAYRRRGLCLSCFALLSEKDLLSSETKDP